jgi:hypothetical protein
VYPLLNPSQLTAAASNRVCNALALLQCVASHNDTRTLFLNGTYIEPHRWMIRRVLMASHLSPHPSVLVSLPQYDFQIPSVRISPSHFVGRDRCACEERFLGCDQLPPHDRDYPSLSPYHGDWVGVEQDSGYFHRAEDSFGRHWPGLYLRDLRALLRRWNGPQQYGDSAGRTANRTIAQACCPLFLEVSVPYSIDDPG